MWSHGELLLQGLRQSLLLDGVGVLKANVGLRMFVSFPV